MAAAKRWLLWWVALLGRIWRALVFWRRPQPDDRGEVEARRRMLRQTGAGIVGMAAMTSGLRSVIAAAREDTNEATRYRWGMVIDLDRCTACGSCAVACRQENNIPTFGPEAVNDGAHIEWMSMYWKEGKNGELPEFLPLPCQQCADPPCVKVCPVGATYKGSDGITYQIWDRCIGCRYCMVACPYSRRSFNWKQPEWDDLSVQLLNPDVATRPAGVVEKCTFCHHRIKSAVEQAKLEDRPVRDEDAMHLTACAAACPAKAITFGDMNNPDSEVSRQAKSPRRFRLLEHLGTEPSVVYLKRDRVE